MSGWRIAGGTGIDASRTVAFEFDGMRCAAHPGDTVASALLASGVRIVGRSFKYHRPRGIVGIGWEEPNALVQCLHPLAAPGVLATTTPVVDGMRLRSVHAWPSARHDLLAFLDAFHPLLPAGFYYKTFMAPQGAWPAYEKVIRRLAGLGRLPATRVRYPGRRRNAWFDVVVVGAGGAGAAAAARAAAAGSTVAWVDDGAEPGGRLLGSPHDPQALAALRETARRLDAMGTVTRLPATHAVTLADHGMVACWQRGEIHTWWRIQAREVVLATGAIERPLVFPGNDRPGVMLASAVTGYLHRYGVACGRRLLVFGRGHDALDCALRARVAGLSVDWADPTEPGGPANMRDANGLADRDGSADQRAPHERAAQAGVTVHAGFTIAAVHGRAGVRGVDLAPLAGGARRSLAVDVVASAGGRTPSLQLFLQAGGRTGWDDARRCVVPREAPAGVSVVGAAAGDGISAVPDPTPWALPGIFTGRAFVDLANDVTAADIALAVREGYRSIEHVKRYTTLGMGVDQGRTAGVNGAGIVAGLLGVPQDQVGVTRARPPAIPVPFDVVAGGEAGDLVRPVRRTAITDWHLAHGAVMVESGANWRRPAYYPRAGETFKQALERECRAVRERVGLYDSTPLGKFEVAGPAAERLLELAYANRVADLAPGRGRYGLMLRDDGRLLDDGVVFRLDASRFWLTTTSGNADLVHGWLEQLRQLRLAGGDEALVTPVGAQWTTLVACGPSARSLLAGCTEGVDLSAQAFPFMAMREARVAGVQARIFRVSFTGELSFEVNLPARQGVRVWEALWAEGRRYGLEAIGSEANHVLRVEKGFLSLGHEVDGIANPLDLGLGWAVKLDKPAFVGRQGLLRAAQSDDGRPQLVGLVPRDGGGPFEEGAQLLRVPEGSDGSEARPAVGRRSVGFVTASVHSHVRGHAVALALLEDGRSRHGESVDVTVQAGTGLSTRPATVCAPFFHDPQGKVMRG